MATKSATKCGFPSPPRFAPGYEGQVLLRSSSYEGQVGLFLHFVVHFVATPSRLRFVDLLGSAARGAGARGKGTLPTLGENERKEIGVYEYV